MSSNRPEEEWELPGYEPPKVSGVTTDEERRAWDSFAAAALIAVRREGVFMGAGVEEATGVAAIADAVLAERRKRFGGGA